MFFALYCSKLWKIYTVFNGLFFLFFRNITFFRCSSSPFCVVFSSYWQYYWFCSLVNVRSFISYTPFYFTQYSVILYSIVLRLFISIWFMSRLSEIIIPSLTFTTSSSIMKLFLLASAFMNNPILPSSSPLKFSFNDSYSLSSSFFTLFCQPIKLLCILSNFMLFSENSSLISYSIVLSLTCPSWPSSYDDFLSTTYWSC